jgi:hypothetical protein
MLQGIGYPEYWEPEHDCVGNDVLRPLAAAPFSVVQVSRQSHRPAIWLAITVC